MTTTLLLRLFVTTRFDVGDLGKTVVVGTTTTFLRLVFEVDFVVVSLMLFSWKATLARPPAPSRSIDRDELVIGRLFRGESDELFGCFVLLSIGGDSLAA